MKKYLYNYSSSSDYKLADEQPNVSYIQETDEISYQGNIVLGTLSEFLEAAGESSIQDINLWGVYPDNNNRTPLYIGGTGNTDSALVCLVNKFEVAPVLYNGTETTEGLTSQFDYNKVIYDKSFTILGLPKIIVTKDILKQLNGILLTLYSNFD